MPRGPSSRGRSSASSSSARPIRNRSPRATKAPPPRPADHVLRLELGAQAARAADARRAGPHRRSIGGEREKRRPVALVGDPAAHGAGGARHRGPPLLRASRRRSDRHGRRAPLEHARHSARTSPAPARSRSSSCATSSCRKFEGMTLQDGAARSRCGASCSRSGCRSSSRRARSKDEILEMYLNDVPLGQRGSFAHRRRRRGRAAVLRQGRQQPDARRGGDDRRRHPVAVGAVAVQQPGALPRAAQRRAAGDGRRRLRHAGGRRRAPSRSRSPSCSARSKPRRRTSSTSSARRSPSSIRASRRRRRRRSTSTRRSTCTCSASRRTPCATA